MGYKIITKQTKITTNLSQFMLTEGDYSFNRELHSFPVETKQLQLSKSVLAGA